VDVLDTSSRPAVASVGILGGSARDMGVPAHLAALVAPDTSAAVFASRIAAFATTAYDRLVVDVAYVETAQRAAVAGCDAIYIDSFADYGIAAMRAVLDVPVIGSGEAALAAAGAGGRRFSIVTVWPPSMAFIYDERLRMTDVGTQCVAVHHVSPETELQRLASGDGVMQRMQRHEDAIVDQLVAACRDAAARDGVDCILLGCTCMAPVGPQIAARLPFPVIECSRVGFTAALAAARSGERHGVVVPERRRMLVPRLVDGLAPGETTATPITAELDQDCPVCVFTPRDGA
jgi:allantoin racemase